ncbi:MAG: hypothetical protein VXW38_08320 [Bacteroidota bacterium]|nr:hypothetical protein [Bacteroidota bacterium]
MNHTNSYFTIHPYNSSYDDGSYVKVFYDGNNKLIHFWNSDSATQFTGVKLGNLYSMGKVGIGTTTFGSHKLAVEGSIGAREIKVEASGWSDFVFANDYELPTLEELEAYITKNKHLPEIPSEAEVTKNGIYLGEMNTKLLQKIEELTLYLIEEHKQNQMLQQKVEQLEQKLEGLDRG